MDKSIFINNRKRLMEEVDDNSVVILFAGNSPKKTADERYPFTPNRNFYYFTGIDEENHIVLISKINGKIKERIFIKEVDPVKEKWEGKSLRKDEAIMTSGIEDVDYLGYFQGNLNKLFGNSVEINLYLDMERDSFNELENIVSNFAKEIKNKYSYVKIKNIYPLIAPLRLVKCDKEIEQIQKAIDITIEGVKSLMKNIKSGMKEYELEAYFDFECKRKGVRDYAFKTIAATGKNATVLHYVDNNSELKEGELILFDLGAQYNYYNGDISRTFPINGKFTDRQKEVYNAVLRVNEAIIKEIKPGIKFLELNKIAKNMIGEECIKLGLIKNIEEVSKYYWHSIGHSLGLDTHDMDMPERDTTLETGMIYTVEPGIYIEEEGIGIRIEDDVLVTNDGRAVLTKKMIKSIDDIEKFMDTNME